MSILDLSLTSFAVISSDPAALFRPSISMTAVISFVVILSSSFLSPHWHVVDHWRHLSETSLHSTQFGNGSHSSRMLVLHPVARAWLPFFFGSSLHSFLIPWSIRLGSLLDRIIRLINLLCLHILCLHSSLASFLFAWRFSCLPDSIMFRCCP
jgi:hypothetical protein